MKLVHLSNGFKVLNSARPFRVGDKCRSAAKILAVTNNDSGKTVTVTGHVLRDGEPVIEVRTSFLYRGRFSDYENTFQIVDEPDFVVELNDASAVGVLQSKEWFDWDNDAKPLLPGTKLIFRVQTEVAYKNKTTYSSVNVTGKVYVHDQLKTLIPVATVDYTNGVSISNPVTAYLQRHGVAQDQPVLFDNAYTLTNANLPATFTAPATNEPYSQTTTRSTSTLTLVTLLPCQALLPMGCGQAWPLTSTLSRLRLSSLKASLTASLRELIS